jgi:hypothetical protein
MAGIFINAGSLQRYGGRIGSLSRRIVSDNLPLLDLLGLPSAAAYSTRLLRTLYTGPCLRVRRSTDNVEQNIGFATDRLLDTPALLTFLGGASGFVTTWYDQSGNSLHLSMSLAANQPRIVNAGVVQNMNSVPALFWPNSSTGLGRTTAINAASQTSLFWVGNVTSVSNRILFSIGSNATGVNGGDLAVFADISSASPGYGEGGWRTPSDFSNSVAANSPVIFSRVSTGALPTSAVEVTNILEYTNGNQKTPTGLFMQVSGFGGYNNLQIGGVTNGSTAPTAGLIGFTAEAIAFPAALTVAQRQLVERNQGAAFGITVA